MNKKDFPLKPGQRWKWCGFQKETEYGIVEVLDESGTAKAIQVFRQEWRLLSVWKPLWYDESGNYEKGWEYLVGQDAPK